MKHRSAKEPCCFISYSYDSDRHIEWSRRLAKDLTSNGVHVFLDQWDVGLGGALPEYIETSIRESDFVLLVCTPEYKRKADARMGGVGYETTVVTGEMFDKIASPGKFVPILRRGDKRTSVPSYLKGRVYEDFCDDRAYETSLENVVRHFYDEPKHRRPPAGKKPDFGAGEQHSARGERSGRVASVAKNVASFARNPLTGMGMGSGEAGRFAELWLDQYSDCDFGEFERVFGFAHNPLSGMGLTAREAKDFGLVWMDKCGSVDFEDFIDIFQHAHNPLTGLGMTALEAKAYALRQVLRGK